MRHTSQHIGLYLLCFALGIFFSQFFDAINENEPGLSKLNEQKHLQKKTLTVFEDTVKKLVNPPQNVSPTEEETGSSRNDKQVNILAKILPLRFLRAVQFTGNGR